MGQRDQLGELQLAILRVLWRRSQASAAEVHEELRETRDLAFTTVATTLANLEKRGAVTHDTEGRKFIYRAVAPEDETQTRLVKELIDRVFLGNSSALLNHLVRKVDLPQDELEQLKDEISRRQAERSDD